MLDEIKNALLRQLEIHDAKYKAEYDKYYEGMCDGIDLSLQEIDKFTDNKNTEPTFDDLIDTATQAFKDGVLDKVELDHKGITYSNDSKESWVSNKENKNYCEQNIKYIKSLYTETFVIENERDCEKFKGVVESLVLANGEDIIDDVMFHKDYPYFTTGMVGTYKLPFKLLKGATVTQKR